MKRPRAYRRWMTLHGCAVHRTAPACAALIMLLAACGTLDSDPGSIDTAADRRVLRVCADPNNLPFSNDREEGFENRLASLLAEELDADLEYTWWAQRRGFVRNTLTAGECDLVTGVPSSFELLLPTRPYYRSTYVFVFRRGSGFDVRSFDDPILRTARVGVHLVGDDYANTPPVHALADRGIVQNLRGYSLYGDYSQPNPPARILDALAAGDIDIAVVWGPLAGYFAPRSPVPLEIVPVSPQIHLPFIPMVYDIGMGVRRSDSTFLGEIEGVLVRRRGDIDAILAEYGVPRLDRAGEAAVQVRPISSAGDSEPASQPGSSGPSSDPENTPARTEPSRPVQASSPATRRSR